MIRNLKQLVLSKNKTFEDLNSNVLVYCSAILISLIGLLITFYAGLVVPKSTLFLILISTITVSATLGGLKAGVITTTITALASYEFFPRLPPHYYETIIFVLNGYLISFVIEIYKKTDITAKFMERENKLKKTLENTQASHEKALEEIKARDEFLSIASHELKTPLTSMLLQIQTALYNIRSVSLANFSVENLMRMLNSAEQQSVQLTKMINDLLNVSLITTGKMDLELQKVDLTKTVKDVLDRFSEKIRQEGQTVNLITNGEIIGFWDQHRIEQATTNLITNALKYGDKKPVEIILKKQNSDAYLIVEDHGIGISDEMQKKIFAKFERASTNKEIQGLGVGLYITNQIIVAHGGNIHVNSHLGKGSTFTVKLPIKEK